MIFIVVWMDSPNIIVEELREMPSSFNFILEIDDETCDADADAPEISLHEAMEGDAETKNVTRQAYVSRTDEVSTGMHVALFMSV